MNRTTWAPEVALDATGEPVELRIGNVPNGVYELNGFIDDASVDGGDATVALDLNLVLPFDL